MKDDGEKNLIINYIYHNIISIKYFKCSLTIFLQYAPQFQKDTTGFVKAFKESSKEIKSEYDKAKISSYNDNNNSKQKINKIKEYLTGKNFKIETEFTPFYLNKISDQLITPEINNFFQAILKEKENMYNLISEECSEYFSISFKILNELKRIYLLKFFSLKNKNESLNSNKFLEETYMKDEEIHEIEKLKDNNDDLTNFNQKNIKFLFQVIYDYNKKIKKLIKIKNLLEGLKLKSGKSEYIQNNLKEEIDALKNKNIENYFTLCQAVEKNALYVNNLDQKILLLKAENKTIKDNYNSLKNENEKLRNRLDKIEQKNSDFLIDLKNIKTQNHKISENLYQIKSKLSFQGKELTGVINEQKCLNERIEKIEKNLKGKERDLFVEKKISAQFEKKSKIKENNVLILNEDIKTISKESEKLNNNYNTSKDKTLKTEIDLDGKISELKNDLKDKGEEVQQLKNDIQNKDNPLKNQYITLNKKIDNLKDKPRDKEASIFELINKNIKLESDLIDLDANNLDFKKNVENL